MDWLPGLELWAGRIGAATGLATLAVALRGFWRGLHRIAGRETGIAHRALRWPFLLLATVIYAGLCALLWQPIPLTLMPLTRLVMLSLGSLLFFSALGLYLWGFHTLGKMFAASSGFGVRLYTDHRLITRGPYAYVRHPMYLAVIIAGLGALLIYKTWAMAFFALNMFGLVLRARGEEQALAAEFAEEWNAYASRVPAWIPCVSILMKLNDFFQN